MDPMPGAAGAAAGEVPQPMHGVGGPGIAVTPQRRPIGVTGNSPTARRPRVIDPSHVNAAQSAAAPAAQANDELTRMVVLHEARLLALEQWAQDAINVMSDHAAKIDVARGQLAGSEAFGIMRQTVELHEGSITSLGREVAGTQAIVEKNDEATKRMIQDNDDRFKADVVAQNAKIQEQFGITTQHCEGLVTALRVQMLELVAAGAGPGGMPAPGPQAPPGIGQPTPPQIQLQMDNLATSAQTALATMQSVIEALKSDHDKKLQDIENMLSRLDAAVRAPGADKQQQQQQQQREAKPPDPWQDPQFANDPWKRAEARKNADRTGPEYFNMSPGPTASGANTSHGGDERKLILDKKLAVLEQHKYTDKDIPVWAQHVRNYLMGQNRCMKAYIKWIEDHGETEITAEEVKSLEHSRHIEACDMSYIQASEALWSWLNLAIGTNASGRLKFDNVDELLGVEVWRKLILPVNSKSTVVKNLLRDKVQNPKHSPTMANIMEYVEMWEKDTGRFIKAGGTKHSDEDKLAQLMKILPPTLSHEMAMRADDYKTPDELKAWMRSKSTFIQERGGKDVVNMAEAECHAAVPGAYEGEAEPEYFDEEIALWIETASDC